MTSNAGKPFLRSFSVIALLALCGCASLPDRAPTQATCEQLFTTSDARIREGETTDVGAARLAGFSYLRTNRFLAALGEQTLKGEDLLEWLERMRELDLRVRRIELQNLYADASRGGFELKQLDRCGLQLLSADLASPKRVAAIRQRAKVADGYRDSARLLGGYPLAVPFLKLGIARWQANTKRAFQEVAEAGGESKNLIEYLPLAPLDALKHDTQIAHWLTAARKKSALGIPELPPHQLQQIAQRYAPIWQVETRGAFDRIGVPYRRDSGLALDSSKPVTYVKPSFARFDGQVLLQLEYTVWFSSRPADYWLDPFAGTLDGVVWRVTLDSDGQPLLYDSIHPCGCYHLFFPTPRLRQRGEPGFWQEAITIATVPTPTDEVVLRIGSGAHFVRAIGAPRLVNPHYEARKYRLRDYNDLRIKRPLRLFDESGMIPGSERLERLFLWPSGVPNAGAMRQSGHRVTAFVGKRYFDDPSLVERYFERVQ